MKKGEEKELPDIFIKLIDFGISISMQDEPLKQEIGTIFYIAPEVLNEYYTIKCDIWSAGVSLYLMLSGNIPFNKSKKSTLQEKMKTFNSLTISKNEDQIERFKKGLIDTKNTLLDCDELLGNRGDKLELIVKKTNILLTPMRER